MEQTKKIEKAKRKNLELVHKETPGVGEVLGIFHDTINPQINFGNKTTRKAAEWLILKYGLQKVLNMSEYACSVQTEPYAPTITTPYQLKEKLAALIKYKLTNDHKKNNQVKLWRKNSTPSQSPEPTMRLVRKPQTESSLPETKTLLNSTTEVLSKSQE